MKRSSRNKRSSLPEVACSDLVRRSKAMRAIASEIDSGHVTKLTAKELFTAAVAAHDLMAYLRHNVGDTADWPLSICSDNTAIAEGLAAKLSSLERLLPPNAELSRAAKGNQ